VQLILIPGCRFGAGDEVAEVAVMLAKTGSITGQTHNVNDGLCLCSKEGFPQDRIRMQPLRKFFKKKGNLEGQFMNCPSRRIR